MRYAIWMRSAEASLQALIVTGNQGFRSTIDVYYARLGTEVTVSVTSHWILMRTLRSFRASAVAAHGSLGPTTMLQLFKDPRAMVKPFTLAQANAEHDLPSGFKNPTRTQQDCLCWHHLSGPIPVAAPRVEVIPTIPLECPPNALLPPFVPPGRAPEACPQRCGEAIDLRPVREVHTIVASSASAEEDSLEERRSREHYFLIIADDCEQSTPPYQGEP